MIPSPTYGCLGLDADAVSVALADVAEAAVGVNLAVRMSAGAGIARPVTLLALVALPVKDARKRLCA